jgi:hypothetical protein
LSTVMHENIVLISHDGIMTCKEGP